MELDDLCCSLEPKPFGSSLNLTAAEVTRGISECCSSFEGQAYLLVSNLQQFLFPLLELTVHKFSH